MSTNQNDQSYSLDPVGSLSIPLILPVILNAAQICEDLEGIYKRHVKPASKRQAQYCSFWLKKLKTIMGNMEAKTIEQIRGECVAFAKDAENLYGNDERNEQVIKGKDAPVMAPECRDFVNRIEKFAEFIKSHQKEILLAEMFALDFFEFDKPLESVRDLFEKEYLNAKMRAASVLEGAQSEANRILAEAKKTAMGAGLSSLQAIFRRKQNWAFGLAGVSLLPLFILPLSFIIACKKELIQSHYLWSTSALSEVLQQHANNADIQKWVVISVISLRLFALGLIGAGVALCLRMFRSYMHIAETNSHRAAVANSMGALVEGSYDETEKKLIVDKAISVIIDFGASGIIGTKEEGGFHEVPSSVVDKMLGKD